MKLQRIEVEGKRFVLLAESDYERLRQRGGEVNEDAANESPALPQPDRLGRVPALQHARISLAHDLIRLRQETGLSQQKLAALADVRPETLSRLEGGKHTASPRTVDKIMDAIESEQKRLAKKHRSSRTRR